MRLIPSTRDAGSLASPAPPIKRSTVGQSSLPPAARRRSLLVAGCAIAAVVPFACVDSGASSIDPDLVLLLHGMAAIKALMVVAAFAAVAWRLGRPVGPRCAAGYLVGMLLVTGATALIGRLTWITPAALVFHAGGLLLLVVAWCDDGTFPRWRTR